MLEPPKLDIHLQHKQALAMGAPASEILYGGAAGGGKSHLLRAAANMFCCGVPGLQCVLFRRTYPDLVNNHLRGPTSFHQMLAPLVNSGHVEIVAKEIRFWNGSRIALSHLQHSSDVYNWQGAEIHLLLFDELTHFTDFEYRYLRGRCRLGGLKLPANYLGRFPRIISGSNPGGLGHNWVKKTFVKPGAYNVYRSHKDEGGMLRTYIPARLEDNPAMTTNDPDYEQRLEGLGDKVLVRAMREGDWDIVAGSMFGDTWRHPLHTCDPFPIPDHWDLWRGGDDGYAAPTAIYWFTQDPQTKTVYVIDEVYRARMLPDEVAERVKTKEKNIQQITHYGDLTTNKRDLSGIYDSAAFADTGQQDAIPRGLQMNKLGLKWKPCEKWPGSRVARVQNLHAMLARNKLDPKGKPRLRFFRNCKHAIETIPTLPRDPDNIEDVDTDAEDHAFDGVTYGLMYKRLGFSRQKLGGV
jgi:hypothetical protein